MAIRQPETTKRVIPIALAARVSDVLARRYSHSRIDHFMELAGIEGQPAPGLNKVDKTRAFLKIANETSQDPLGALGIVLTEFMEADSSLYVEGTEQAEDRSKIGQALAVHGLHYSQGGFIVASGTTAVSKSLDETIRQRDLPGLRTEFDRIFKNVESDPPAAVTASCALLEALFKIYIEEIGLEMPADRSIKPLWKVVRAQLKLDPSVVQDEDLRTVLKGLGAIVEGIGALRTHRGSAHGQGKTVYKLKPRHARLAAHAAFTLSTYVLELWNAPGSDDAT